jgi:hypothetical protein
VNFQNQSSVFKWAAIGALAAAALLAVGSASARTSWSVQIGTPGFVEPYPVAPSYYPPAPVYYPPAPIYYAPPPPVYYRPPPPPVYYRPAPVYVQPPGRVYYGPGYPYRPPNGDWYEDRD